MNLELTPYQVYLYQSFSKSVESTSCKNRLKALIVALTRDRQLLRAAFTAKVCGEDVESYDVDLSLESQLVVRNAEVTLHSNDPSVASATLMELREMAIALRFQCLSIQRAIDTVEVLPSLSEVLKK